MPSFTETCQAGSRAEQIVRQVLNSYTRHIYSNVWIDTLLTKSGYTEVDMIAAVADVVLIVEVKNIKAIRGRVEDNTWFLTGYEAGQEYSALNILTQNRIHARSFKDAWFKLKSEFPATLSVVAVPNGCNMPEDIAASGVYEVGRLDQQLAELCKGVIYPKYGTALDFVIQSDGNHICRPDFY